MGKSDLVQRRKEESTVGRKSRRKQVAQDLEEQVGRGRIEDVVRGQWAPASDRCMRYGSLR